MKKIKQLGGLKMRKVFAIAFILFMFASTTTALAGDKRFCGYISIEDSIAQAVGKWADKDNVFFKLDCMDGVTEAKAYLTQMGVCLWDKHDWKKKKGNKCGKISNFFRKGGSICGKKKWMNKDLQLYHVYVSDTESTADKVIWDGTSCK